MHKRINAELHEFRTACNNEQRYTRTRNTNHLQPQPQKPHDFKHFINAIHYFNKIKQKKTQGVIDGVKTLNTLLNYWRCEQRSSGLIEN